MKRIGIWLDDFRDPKALRHQELFKSYDTDEILWAKGFDEFQDIINDIVKNPGDRVLHSVFFDNDLGDRFSREGRHAFTWLENLIHEHELHRILLYAQTDNGAAKQELYRGFNALDRYWVSVGK